MRVERLFIMRLGSPSPNSSFAIPKATNIICILSISAVYLQFWPHLWVLDSCPLAIWRFHQILHWHLKLNISKLSSQFLSAPTSHLPQYIVSPQISLFLCSFTSFLSCILEVNLDFSSPCSSSLNFHLKSISKTHGFQYTWNSPTSLLLSHTKPPLPLAWIK